MSRPASSKIVKIETDVPINQIYFATGAAPVPELPPVSEHSGSGTPGAGFEKTRQKIKQHAIYN